MRHPVYVQYILVPENSISLILVVIVNVSCGILRYFTNGSEHILDQVAYDSITQLEVFL